MLNSFWPGMLLDMAADLSRTSRDDPELNRANDCLKANQRIPEVVGRSDRRQRSGV